MRSTAYGATALGVLGGALVGAGMSYVVWYLLSATPYLWEARPEIPTPAGMVLGAVLCGLGMRVGDLVRAVWRWWRR